MKVVRIGCSTITFSSRPVEEALQRIADLGFDVIDLAAVPSFIDHVQLIDPPAGHADRLAALVDRHGFEVAALQSVPWLPDALDHPAELRRRYTVAADVAQAVGARAWIVDAGKAHQGADESARAAGLDRFTRTITMAAELAEARGLRLGVEAPHIGTLAQTLPETLELLDVADLPRLGVDLDTSHLLSSGAATADVLDALGPRVVHVALRDGRRDGPFCTPGDGDFDFGEFFRLLDGTGYTGDATLELEPARPDASAEDRATEAERARRYLAPLLTTAEPV